jgi:hypothetical protein
MGKRQRRRTKASSASERATTTSDYPDSDGNVLTLRDSVSAATVRKLTQHEGSAAATTEDVHQRRAEMLFERLAVRWTIAGLPLEGQRELLGRYRMADRETRDWIAATIAEHLRQGGIELP